MTADSQVGDPSERFAFEKARVVISMNKPKMPAVFPPANLSTSSQSSHARDMQEQPRNPLETFPKVVVGCHNRAKSS